MTAATDVAIPPVERQVAWDMIRRALPVAPALVVLASIPWGLAGGASAGYAIAIVLVNFGLSALLLGWAARISLPVLMATAMFGYLLRLGLISAAVWVVKDQSWVSIVPLGLTLIVTHLGLLFWETRHVSVSLAFPGLKPLKPTEKGQ
jgi:hypothetical protein